MARDRTLTMTGDIRLPLGFWCDECWVTIEARSREVAATFDAMVESGSSPADAWAAVDAMLDRKLPS